MKLKMEKAIKKEYWENDKLKFEVNYLNGVSNGKGKEYYFDGALRFKGDYLNGKRNGLVEEYYGNVNIKNSENILKEHNELKFEGKYLNGERHGKGKEYNWKGKLIFDGEFLMEKEMA